MKIEISKPCTVNRDEMIKTEQGWFCQACEKDVIDFRGQDDAAIKQALDGSKQCGVFRSSQLKRPILEKNDCSRARGILAAIGLALTASAISLESCFMGKPSPPDKSLQNPIETSEPEEQFEMGEASVDDSLHIPTPTRKAEKFHK